MSMIVKPRVVGIIGCGQVGAHVAFALAVRGVTDVLLLSDIDMLKAKAQVMDIEDAITYLPHRVICKTCTPEELGSCDVIVLAAGALPKKGETRLDSLPATMRIVDSVISGLKKAYLQKALGLPPERVIATGTALDSARLQHIIGRELNFSVTPASLHSAYMLGEHGDSCIPAWSHVMIGNKPLDELQKEQPNKYPNFDRNRVNEEIHKRAFVIIEGKRSTDYGISIAASEIIKAIFHDEHKVLPCSVLLQGQYGEHDVYASVPVVIGARGVEDILELKLTPEENDGFHKSCEIMRIYVKRAYELIPM